MIVDIAGGAVIGCDDLGNPAHPAVILSGGLATQRTVWPDLLCTALVDAGYRVIRFDNRDIGLSTWLDDLGVPDIPGLMAAAASGKSGEVPYTLDDMADDAVAVLDSLGIDAAHICGASMGGMICSGIARDREAVHYLSGMAVIGGPPDAGFLTTPAAKRRMPIYLSQGSADSVYPVEGQAAVYRKLRAAGYPVRLTVFNTGGHGTPIRMTDWRKLLNFLLTAD